MNINSAAILGLDAFLVNIEVNIDNRGFPSFDIVGLAAKEINESKERVKAAIRNSGFKFPNKKITVNLAPADLPKKGSLYDLPIAIGILSSVGLINTPLDDFLFAGELSLNGTISPISGATLIALEAKLKNKILVIPEDNLTEVSFIKGLKILTYKNLECAVNSLQQQDYKFHKTLGFDSLRGKNFTENLIENIKGHELAKRAVAIAAAGKHNICIVGSPGSGKTLLAKSFETILPDLTEEDFFEVMKIRSLNRENFSLAPAFRSPSHPITKRTLYGGGVPFALGEIVFAHKGVLFLDEFTELDSQIINSLRQPLEAKTIDLNYKNRKLTLSSDFMLVISANPCPCGNYGDPDKKCVCTPSQIKNYLTKLKNPLMDRVDIFINVYSISSEELLSEKSAPQASAKLKSFLTGVRDSQIMRSENLNLRFKPNANLSVQELKLICTLDSDAVKTMNSLHKKYSSRSIHKILKVSRTIADLENSADIKNNHILEAIQYKSYFAS